MSFKIFNGLKDKKVEILSLKVKFEIFVVKNMEIDILIELMNELCVEID